MSEALTAGDPPSAPPLRELRRLLPYVRPHRAALIGSGGAALAATLAGLAIPLVTRAIVDGRLRTGSSTPCPGSSSACWRSAPSKPG
jgi:ATP-binding cassette, subfamily B, bacterial